MNPNAGNGRGAYLQQAGKRGEALAADALIKAGYIILDRNWNSPIGELDIIARHRDEIVFVEVRSRTDSLDAALESISERKQKTLMRLAELYMSQHDLESASFRIDVVAVNLKTRAIEIIENAVGW